MTGYWRVWGALYGKRIGSDIRILLVSKPGNYNVLSLVKSGGTYYGKITRGDFGIIIFSKIGIYDGMLLGDRVYLTVVNSGKKLMTPDNSNYEYVIFLITEKTIIILACKHTWIRQSICIR